MKKILIIVVIIVVAGIGIYRNAGIKGEDPGVTVEAFSNHDISASILASGSLIHEDEVQLTTEVIGKVMEVFVEEGDRVEKDQLLLRIDDEAVLSNVDRGEANVRQQEIAIRNQELWVANLESQWNRRQKLYENGALDENAFELATNELERARNDLDSRREQLKQAEANLEETMDRLSKTRVVSPMAGVITSLDIEAGETAIASTTNVPGSGLMTIADPESILTEVNVDEADIGNVEVGQKVEIVAIAYPDTPMEGVVDSIAMSAKRADGSQSLSFVVKIQFTDTKGINLRPGMSCRAEIFTSENDPRPSVPIQSILIEEDLSEDRLDYTVFVHENGTAQRRIIEVGLSDDEYQEVTSGIELGEEVITGPDRVIRTLSDGASVRVVENTEENSEG